MKRPRLRRGLDKQLCTTASELPGTMSARHAEAVQHRAASCSIVQHRAASCSIVQHRAAMPFGVAGISFFSLRAHIDSH